MRRDGLGIAGVALEDLHGDGAALRAGHQSEDDLRVAAAFIAGMAEAGQRAVAAFKVSGADVVEDQRALGKMAFGESVFDFLLAQKQPIHGVIELGFLDGGVQTEHGRQRGGGGIGMKAAGSSEFGGGIEDAGDDDGDDQIALGATGAREDRFQKEAANSAESGGDVAVRSRALNVESVGGGDERFALEDTAEGVDLGGGPRREVGEGTFDDLGALAEALAEEDGGRGVAVGDGLYIHGYSIFNTH